MVLKNKLCFILFALFFILQGCSKDTVNIIKENGALTVITNNSTHGYYSCQEQPSGFEYELALKYAEYLGVELRVITPGWSNMRNSLNKGDGDFIAASFTKNFYRENFYDFSDAYMRIKEYLVVNKANYTIENIADLNGKEINVRKGTSYEYTLRKLWEKGIDLKIITHKNIPTEELIRQVNDGEIEITVADTHIARLNQRYYPEVKIICPISSSEKLCWAVKKGNMPLAKSMNKFLKKIKNNGIFESIYAKYYSNIEVFDYVDIKKFHTRLKTRLPKFSNIIKTVSQEKNIDWRLIAAIIYQESHFNPRAKSHTGVRGLMQLTLTTAGELGITNRLNPEQSIFGGASYLKILESRFGEIPVDERMKFALASYNVGYGHVRDAQKLAASKGWDKDSWAGISKALPLLRFEKYFRNTKYGYARGTEPVRYVNRIYTYYDILKNKYKPIVNSICCDEKDPLI